jgi:iron complex outermembrane recepter protein
MRITLAVAVACLTLGGLAAAGDATAAIRKETYIPAEGLGPALTKLAKEFDFQVLYRTEIVSDLKSPGAVGALTSDEALGKVLTGTGLTYKYLDDKTVTIVPTSAGSAEQSTTQSISSGSSDDANVPKEAGKKSSQDFRVAQVDQGKNASNSSVGEQISQDNAKNSSPALSEIIVTAEKRSERLQNVPIPVAVVSGETLLDQNISQMKDFYSMVPGVNFAQGEEGFFPGDGNITIRGINTVTAVLVDDVPYGSTSSNIAGIAGIPDIDPGDLDHIEILRGPQGTLYGAQSMGGLVKYVTVDPSTEGASGRLQGGFSSVYNGAELGYSYRGSINVPLSDSLAVRGSAFTRLDPGYIDDPVLYANGLNKTETDGGRFAALWKPSDAFSLRFSAVFQDSHLSGSPETDIQPGLGDLEQDRIRGTGKWDTLANVYSLVANAKLGNASLTSVTGYSYNAFVANIDYSYAVPTWTLPIKGYVDRYTEDLRLLLPIGSHIDWLFGVFYDYEDTRYLEGITTANPATGAVTGTVLSLLIPDFYSEDAAYTDLTLKLTDRFDIQFGGRVSKLKQRSGTITNIPGVGTSVQPELYNSATPLTYLVTPQFKVSPDLMAYIRLASGYRPGGPNNPIAVENGAAASYKPDFTKNYELGVKGDFLNHALSFDASAYYIDWQNIQIGFALPLAEGGWSYTGNGSAAKSEGVELSVEAKPLQGLTISGWVDYDDAAITKAPPPGSTAVLYPGERLPNVSRFSASIAANEEFPLFAGWTGLVGGDVSYVGDRTSAINPVTGGPPITYPSYAKVDLRVAAMYQDWTLSLFANNLADRRGIVGGGSGNYNPTAVYYIQPRTLGMFFVRKF